MQEAAHRCVDQLSQGWEGILSGPDPNIDPSEPHLRVARALLCLGLPGYARSLLSYVPASKGAPLRQQIDDVLHKLDEETEDQDQNQGPTLEDVLTGRLALRAPGMPLFLREPTRPDLGSLEPLWAALTAGFPVAVRPVAGPRGGPAAPDRAPEETLIPQRELVAIRALAAGEVFFAERPLASAFRSQFPAGWERAALCLGLAAQAPEAATGDLEGPLGLGLLLRTSDLQARPELVPFLPRWAGYVWARRHLGLAGAPRCPPAGWFFEAGARCEANMLAIHWAAAPDPRQAEALRPLVALADARQEALSSRAGPQPPPISPAGPPAPPSGPPADLGLTMAQERRYRRIFGSASNGDSFSGKPIGLQGACDADASEGGAGDEDEDDNDEDEDDNDDDDADVGVGLYRVASMLNHCASLCLYACLRLWLCLCLCILCLCILCLCILCLDGQLLAREQRAAPVPPRVRGRPARAISARTHPARAQASP
ncbi:hypothetical protein PAPYR_7861 [Paratrimastix pyriformis]|uniref:Uncharacterized protein n=1 Tax=Paratrimastix pyriformis TaxID=342808 RepID=A0ABQ8UC26_9EUKA|nr:hypothetical protein PAPYR_7861 [Paratrimastix pyriformis]